jgi:hypothetical protein
VFFCDFLSRIKRRGSQHLDFVYDIQRVVKYERQHPEAKEKREKSRAYQKETSAKGRNEARKKGTSSQTKQWEMPPRRTKRNRPWHVYSFLHSVSARYKSPC